MLYPTQMTGAPARAEGPERQEAGGGALRGTSHGLQRGPIAHGACGETDWLARACPVIRERIERYASSEIRFNLMALVRDRKDALEEKIAAATARMNDESRENALGDAERAELAANAHAWKEELSRETERRAVWRDENIRRKHNYIPFIFNLLEACAERGERCPCLASDPCIP